VNDFSSVLTRLRHILCGRFGAFVRRGEAKVLWDIMFRVFLCPWWRGEERRREEESIHHHPMMIEAQKERGECPEVCFDCVASDCSLLCVVNVFRRNPASLKCFGSKWATTGKQYWRRGENRKCATGVRWTSFAHPQNLWKAVACSVELVGGHEGRNPLWNV